MRFLKDKVICAIGDPIKTINAKNHQSELCFKSYINKALCVRHYLSQYRQRTEPLRGKQEGGGGIGPLDNLYTASYAYQEEYTNFLGKVRSVPQWSGHGQIHSSLNQVSLNQQSEDNCAVVHYHENCWLEKCFHFCSILWKENREWGVDFTRPALTRKKLFILNLEGSVHYLNYKLYRFTF